jgi:hypothetical protein
MSSPVSEENGPLSPIDRRGKIAELILIGLLRVCRGRRASGFEKLSESRADGLDVGSNSRLSVSRVPPLGPSSGGVHGSHSRKPNRS